MRVDVDRLITMWQTAVSDPKQREECQKSTDALAKKLAKTRSGENLRKVSVRLLKAMTPEMEAKLVEWMSGDMAAKGVRGFENQSNFYYSIKRLVSALQAPAKASNVVEFAQQLPHQIFGDKSDRLHPEIRFCVEKLSQVMKQAWQVKEFPALKQDKTWFHLLPVDLMPNLAYFPTEEWLEKACLHPCYQKQMIDAINTFEIALTSLGISNSVALEAFVKLYGRELTSLNLSSCPFISDRDIDAILSHVPSIQYLSLATLNNLSDASIQRFANSYPKLKSLQLDATDVSNETVERFANPNLTTLSLLRCSQVSDAALTYVAKTCPQLRSLKLAGLKGPLVTETALSELAQRCTNLQMPLDIDMERLRHLPPHLWLAQNYHNAPRSIMVRKAFIQLMNADKTTPTLSGLGITNRQKLHDFLAEYSKELKNLNLRGCEFFEDDDLALIAEATPELEDLYLVDSPRLTDASLSSVAEKWGNLTKLYLSNCPQISIEAIHQFISNHPKISTLCCPNVSFDVLLTFAKECPELKYILIANKNGSLNEFRLFKDNLLEINKNIVILQTSIF